jgi:ribosomal protein L29
VIKGYEIMDKNELKKLDAAALRNEVMLLKKELFNLKLNLISGQVKDMSQFKKLRTKIAQTLTFANMKQQEKKNKKNSKVKN